MSNDILNAIREELAAIKVPGAETAEPETTFEELDVDSLDLVELVKALEDKSWKAVEAETEDGVRCTTGQGGPCPAGPPGKLKLVLPSEADLKARDAALNDIVLKSWAKRCGEACAAKWTDTVGKKYGLTAKAD